MALKRLDKLIALNCNVSRKDARQLIKDKAVTVNGQVMLRAEELIDSECDDVSVKGYNFSMKDHVYIMLNKPEGVISATDDAKKETVIDLIPDSLARRSLFPCGRLDKDTTGILIITDDGALCHKIMSPSHHVFKTYIAQLEFPLYNCDIEKLQNGIMLGDGTECLPALVKYFENNGLFYAKICIREGKYHQVKRMFNAVGNNVLHLHRESIGVLKLDDSLAPGKCRELREDELKMLFEDITFL